MEAASMIRSSPRSPFPISSPHKFRTNFTATKSQISLPLMEKNEGTRNVSLRCSPRTHQAEIIDQASGVRSDVEDLEELVRIKDWEVGMYQNELAVRDGIRIRRRPPTEPPRSYYGPFEFELRNQGTSPINILEDIIWTKHAEVLQLKENKPIEEVKKEINNTEVRDFVQALKESHLRTGLPALIAEVKKASPSRGVIRKDFDPVQIAQAYEKGGAACLSVLTDAKYFQGGFENLEAVRNAGIKCPLLCKEFIIDVYQIYYARSKGADAVLLIAAVLPDIDIRYMIKICKTLGLAALVEVHDEREMDRILAIEGIELIGINNRSLETFEVDISNTKKLLEGDRGKTIRDKNIIVVGESGLFTPDDVAYVQNAGVKAVSSLQAIKKVFY
ncbi:indole-3-glycerol-phosphate synthase [Ranunculus cassubicifolius]